MNAVAMEGDFEEITPHDRLNDHDWPSLSLLTAFSDCSFCCSSSLEPNVDGVNSRRMVRAGVHSSAAQSGKWQGAVASRSS